MTYDDVAGSGLSERKKSFNVQCYCDAREFECIATGLVRLGVLNTPIKASTVLNEVVRCMCKTMIKNKQGMYNMKPSDAIEGLVRLGVSVSQLSDRRGRAITRHLQQESLVLEKCEQFDHLSGGDIDRAVDELEKMEREKEPEDFSALGGVPDNMEVVKDEEDGG